MYYKIKIFYIIGKFDELPYDDSGVKRSEFPLQANFSNLAQQYLSTMRRIASRQIMKNNKFHLNSESDKIRLNLQMEKSKIYRCSVFLVWYLLIIKGI